MNDIRRTILWVIFGFSLVLLWDKWQVHSGKKATFFPAPAVATAPAPETGKAPGDASVPSAAAAATAGAGEVPGGAAAAPEAAPRQNVTISTDVLRLTFDSQGGTLRHAELLKYADSVHKDKPVVLFDESVHRVYLGQSGLIGGGFPTHKTTMTALPGARELKDGEDQMELRFESPDMGGVKLVKIWTLKRGAYDIGVRHEVVNTGTAAVSPQLYLQLVRDGNKPEGEQSTMYSTFTGPAVYTDEKKYQKVEFKDIESGKASVEKSSSGGYVAMVQHYFASAWLLAEGIQRDNFLRKVDNNLYAVGMITPVGTIEPGQSKSVEARLFAGPQIEKRLESLAPGLELV